jgi:hypothetical protein
MDIFTSEVIFEQQDNLPKSDVIIPPNVPEIHKEVMTEFLQSGYFFDNHLYIDKFLDEDLTIDLEKLELAIVLIVEYLENSVKNKKPIYVFLGNMDRYFTRRHTRLSNIEQITEESSFILGFCQSIADNESDNRKFIFQYATKT